MSHLTILNTSIRTIDNLYSLNDLHRASGAEDKHSPFRFMRNEQTKDLITEINSQTPNLVASKIIRGGTDLTIRGYWVCKELVIAYAAWVSSKFHLTVLQVFLNQMESQPKQPTLPTPKPEPLLYRALTESEWLQFAAHWFALYNTLNLLSDLEEPLRAIGSTFAVTAYTHAHEYANNLGLMKRILEPMLEDLEVDPIDEPFKYNALKTLREFKVKGIANAVRLSNQTPRPVKNYALPQN
ncbi:P22AR C-terminal domain-containing protein [Lonepinella sp. BR2474]|uniref:P22AR C-terminal domain-containing protein n=1 Tax=Lonepinella sp. BR2474 TaxID=3434548 RepID=UPI003F6E1F7E